MSLINVSSDAASDVDAAADAAYPQDGTVMTDYC